MSSDKLTRLADLVRIREALRGGWPVLTIYDVETGAIVRRVMAYGPVGAMYEIPDNHRDDDESERT